VTRSQHVGVIGGVYMMLARTRTILLLALLAVVFVAVLLYRRAPQPTACTARPGNPIKV
jgi:hypothetical protein